MTEANISNLSNVEPKLPKIMSVKTFNRIYGGHETLGGVYKLHQNKKSSQNFSLQHSSFSVLFVAVYMQKVLVQFLVVQQ